MIYYIQPWIYPIILTFSMTLACLIPYFKATSVGDVEKDFPFISDTGNKGVAASVFSMFFSINSFLLFINITIRFELVRSVYDFENHKKFFITNLACTVVGMVSCVGVIFAGNFQLDTHESLHNLGAATAFGLGNLYLFIQVICSFLWKNIPGNNLVINILRIVFYIMHFAFLIGTFVLALEYKETKDLSIKRKAAILEWILFFVGTLCFLTYVPEFYKYSWRIELSQRPCKQNKIGDNSIEREVSSNSLKQKENRVDDNFGEAKDSSNSFKRKGTLPPIKPLGNQEEV